ncbi:MAG: hypothetical protein ACI4VF_09715 [Lachnospirales bacterium]
MYNQMIVNNVLYDNYWLRTALEKAERDNMNMRARINQLEKTDILRTEALVPARNCTYYNVVRNDGTRNSMNYFGMWHIVSAYPVYYDPRYKLPGFIYIKVKDDNKEGTFIISEKEFTPKKVLEIFNKNGFSVILKDTAEKLGLLLIRHIYEIASNSNTMYVPYNNGWETDTNNNNVYYLAESKIFDIDSPYTNSLLTLSNTNEPIKSCEISLGIFSVFNNDTQKIMILGALIYSINFSLLKRYGIEANKFLILSGDNNLVNKIADLFFNIFSYRGFVGLRSGVVKFNKEISYVKDSPLIIDSRDCNFKDKAVKGNFDTIKELSCYRGAIDVDSVKFNSQALTILLSNALSYIINPSLFFDIEVDDVNLKALNDALKKKCYLGDTIKDYLTYAATLNIPDIINSESFEGVKEDSYDTYRAIKISLVMFEKFLFNKYSLSLNKLLNLKFNYDSYIKAFFERDIVDTKNITKLYLDTVYDTIESGILVKKYDNKLHTSDDINKYVFIFDNEIWISYDTVNNVIVRNMNMGLKTKNVLKILQDENILIHNRGSFECKRTIDYLDADNAQRSFVIVKTKNENGGSKNEKNAVINYWDF